MWLIRKEIVTEENWKVKRQVIQYKKDKIRGNFVKIYQEYLEELLFLNKDAYKILFSIIKNYEYDGLYIERLRWYIKNVDVKVNFYRGLKELEEKKIIFIENNLIKLNRRYFQKGVY